MNLWADKDDNEGRLTGNLRGFTPRHYYNCDLGDKGESMKDAHGEEISNNLDDIRSQLQALTRQLEISNRLTIKQMNHKGMFEGWTNADTIEFWENVVAGERA